MLPITSDQHARTAWIRFATDMAIATRLAPVLVTRDMMRLRTAVPVMPIILVQHVRIAWIRFAMVTATATH